MYQSITIVGNLGREPEMRYAPSGKPVTSFSVAVSDGFGEHKKTVWFKVTAWDKQAESCAQYLHKGSKVLVEGHLQATDQGECRTWTGTDGRVRATFELTASTVRFLSTPQEEGQQQDRAPAATPEAAEVPF
jgi:single-strand DNA-binding protein